MLCFSALPFSSPLTRVSGALFSYSNFFVLHFHLFLSYLLPIQLHFFSCKVKSESIILFSFFSRSIFLLFYYILFYIFFLLICFLESLPPASLFFLLLSHNPKLHRGVWLPTLCTHSPVVCIKGCVCLCMWNSVYLCEAVCVYSCPSFQQRIVVLFSKRMSWLLPSEACRSVCESSTEDWQHRCDWKMV